MLYCTHRFVWTVSEIDDVTNAVLFLLSDQSAMISGTTMVVDGGLLCN